MTTSPSIDWKLFVALAIYITALIAANTLGLKLMPFLFGSHLSVGIFSFPIVFLMTDVISEVYDKKTARMFVIAGFVSTVLWMILSYVSIITPWSVDGLWVRTGYLQVFGVSLRLALASLVAFFIGEYQDVFVFFLLKTKIGVKHFWLRSALSNLWSQLLDTVIFMVIAFYGVYPLKTLGSIILTWWLYKVFMGLIYTPLSYVGIYLLKKRETV